MPGPDPTPATPPRPVSRRAERTRQRILDAAARLLARQGWARTTVESIASQAGVSKALIYHHFRGKETILEAVVERTLDQWDEACRREGWPHGEDVLASLGAMHRCALRYARENPLLRALFQLDPAVLLDMRRSAPVLRSLETFHAELVEVLQRGVVTGQLRRDLDVEHVADVVRLLHLAFVEHLFEPEWADVSNERLIDASLDVLFRGIAAEARP